MERIVLVHRKDENNVGDLASNPLQYFLKPSEYRVVDVDEIDKKCYPDHLPMIIGGGGLIGNDLFGDFYRDVLQSSDRSQLERMSLEGWQLSNSEYRQVFDEFQEKFSELVRNTTRRLPTSVGPRFIWGAGHNGSDTDINFTDIKWPKSFSQFKKIGIRDYHPNLRFSWVPCASCLHPALRKNYAIKNDIIWFEHKKQLLKPVDFGRGSVPRFVNSGSNVEQTIELLGSANIILTNSYHGAYWGTLLKKKVIVVGPWSTKFKFFKHPPLLVGKRFDFDEVIDKARVFDTALDECSDANLKYWEEIKVML